jgi:epoxyqueuosine reductase
MLDREYLIQVAVNFTRDSQLNYVGQKDAINDLVCGMRIFDSPIFAFGAADDPYFKLLQNPSAIGQHFLLPTDWLPGAKTVISFFLPFSEAVRRSNAIDHKRPSPEWLHGRIEGQEFVKALCFCLRDEIEKEGFKAVVPSYDKRFWSHTEDKESDKDRTTKVQFTSNWSERHVAFVCGLGTFGLSKGLITKAGIAGRFGSLVTDLVIDPDVRGYTEVYEYCLMCGDCAQNCPVHAISVENGKNHSVCSRFVSKTKELYYPRYGCGKCQVGVPCERQIPRDK